MKYQPSLPDTNVNVSHDNPIKEFFILLLGLIGFIVITYWCLGLCVDVAISSISPEAETKIFSVLPKKFSSTSEKHEVEQAKLQNIMDELCQCADLPYPLKVKIVDMDEVNAMAIPGGNVVVFSGLLKNLKSENGLTFILAHELGHFVNRDHLRGMGRSIVFIALSAMITGNNSDLTAMLTPTSSFNIAQYSQERESLADLEALRGMNCIYGHVGGATEFFESIRKTQKKNLIPLTRYFGTHPELADRIESLKQNAKALGYESGPVIFNVKKQL